MIQLLGIGLVGAAYALWRQGQRINALEASLARVDGHLRQRIDEVETALNPNRPGGAADA